MQLIILTALVLSLLGQPDPAGSPDDFLSGMRGQELAQERCAACHAVGRDDLRPDPEAPAFRDLHLRSPLLFEDPELNARMTLGHPVMPDIGLTPAQLADLTAYLRSLEEEADGPIF